MNATVDHRSSDRSSDRAQRPRMTEFSPYVGLVARAKKHPEKRYALRGRYNVRPYPGRSVASEAYTAMSSLHRAAEMNNVRVSVRRFDNDGETCRIMFRII